MAGLDGTKLDDSLRAAVIKHARVKPLTIRDGDRIAGDLGYDSYALVNLLLELEDAWGVEIDASELAGFREMSYGELRAFVRARLGAERSPDRAAERAP